MNLTPTFSGWSGRWRQFVLKIAKGKWGWLQHWGVGDWLSLVLTLLGGLAVLGGFAGLVWQPTSETSAESLAAVAEAQAIPELGQLLVSVTGAVVAPGLYELQDGDRVAQAIAAAGGFQTNADKTQISGLNLAEKLIDGQQIKINFQPSATSPSPTQSSAESQSADSESPLININTASQTELESLPGIGAVRAQSIIENRPYQSSSELVSKEVMGQSTYDKLKQLISI